MSSILCFRGNGQFRVVDSNRPTVTRALQVVSFGNVYTYDLWSTRVSYREEQVAGLSTCLRASTQHRVHGVNRPLFSMVAPLHRFFYHAVNDLIQLVWVYLERGYDCDILINFSWLDDFIGVFIPLDRLIDIRSVPGPWHVQHLTLVNYSHWIDTYRPFRTMLWPTLVEALAPVPFSSLARVLLARSHTDVNSFNDPTYCVSCIADLYALLERDGFVRLRVGRQGVSLREQIKTMQHAKVLFLDYGSGLANVLWMSPGALVFTLCPSSGDRWMQCASQIENEPYRLTSFERMAEEAGGFLYMVIGTTQKVLDPAVTVELLHRVEEELRDGFDAHAHLVRHGRDKVKPPFSMTDALNQHLAATWPRAQGLVDNQLRTSGAERGGVLLSET
mmetsp:Transcript_30306/g.65537  ORF Transcript_30306/g.65537 Transcript_30306/m.65537 type:complete len:389 (+) Transcript_30306:280-1446(+)